MKKFKGKTKASRSIELEANYKRSWEKLFGCLQLEVQLCNECMNDSIANKDYSEAARVYENLNTVEWVLDEMSNIEKHGECL